MVTSLLLIFCMLFNIANARLVPAPNYVLNLSLPATEIWAEVAKDYAPKFPKLFKEIESKLPKELLDEIASITPVLDKYIYPQYVNEMKGIAKYGNVSLERIVLLNLLYDIHAYDQSRTLPSVSVVVDSGYDPNNPIIVASTFSWAYTPLLREMVIVVGTKIPAQYILRGTTFAGMVGLHAGVTAGDFSASYIERKAGVDDTWRNIFKSLKANNYTTISTLSLMIRHKLQYDPLGSLFLHAVLDFSSMSLISPTYLAIGGWNGGQGVIITHDGYAAMDKKFLSQGVSGLYLVGSNSEPWSTPDSVKAYLESKFKTANKTMDVGDLLRFLQDPKLFSDNTVFVTATTPCYWGPFSTLIYYPDS